MSVYIYYVAAFVFFTPYPGIVFTAVQDGWQINDSSQPKLPIGTKLTQIGDLTFLEYQHNRNKEPFAGYQPGQTVVITTIDNTQPIQIQIPAPSFTDRLKRTVFTGWFIIFWLPGTLILLFLRPRDRRWQLLVTFMYLIAIWVLVGIVSPWRIGASRLILGAVTWFMLPIFLHLHINVPSQLFPKTSPAIITLLYISAAILAALEIFQIPPTNAPPLGAIIAILGSVSLLIYRLLKSPRHSSDLVAARLMLAGIALAFLPGLLFQLLPQILSIPASSILSLSFIYLAIPALPLFYTYAIYKRQLGIVEFRVNRFLSLYSFLLVYPPAFLILVLLGDQWITSSSARTIYLLFTSFAFVILTPPLLDRFQKGINRLAYGTEFNPDEVIRVLANQAPPVLSQQTLVNVILNKILPSMLIRQSSLLLYEGANKSTSLYTQNIPESDQQPSRQQILKLAGMARFYLSPFSEDADDPYTWLRLVIPLTLRDKTIGVWLFGRRDPDDFYAQTDIELLQTVANQVATALENIRLYQTLKGQADQLAAQVTERTSELQAERDRTQAILDSAGEGIFFMDPRGTILYTNPTMTNLTGYPPTEILGQTPHHWEDGTDSQSKYGELWHAIESGVKWQGELVQRRKDGTPYHARVIVTPLQTGQNGIDGFVGVLSDISKFKEVDRLKSNIIANVSHELKTPLTNIRMYINLMERGNPEKYAKYLAVLNRESERLTRLILELLDLSRLESGEVKTQLTPTNISEYIERVVDASAAQAQRKQIMVQAEMPIDLPLVLVDESQIEQVFTNLLTNALNYTFEGGQVGVWAETFADDEGSWVVVQISDNGPGIAEEDLPHLFERFYRGHVGRESQMPGTGLGLAICKEIIDQHQGRIEVDSQVGSGSVFRVWLKAAA
ncbi:MAG: PAS domain S-box protein [Ardenticatenaceae bacterium]|nr:PAS domain S-box protein [Ardenticatenaceae bacterium]